MKKPIKGYHRHHKTPKHAGGTDDDDNIEYVTIEEHIAAHRRLYETYGKKADLASANFLHASLYVNFDEVKQQLFRDMCARGAEEAHRVKQENGFYQRLGKINSAKLKGRIRPDISEGQRRKWKERRLIWCNNGTVSKRFISCPEGWIDGRLSYHTAETKMKAGLATAGTKWWTNGTNNQRTVTSPGEDWYQGRSKRKHP